jgi:hypothetical protein
MGGLQITEARLSGRGPVCVAYVFVFLHNIIICPLYKLTLLYLAQVTVQLTVGLSDLV